MLILGIDTSGKAASVALCRDNMVLGEVFVNSGITHSQTLMPAIDSLLTLCQVKIEDVELLACSQGPGSFTGLRIGASIAKGLAFAKKLKIVPVCSLQALAFNVAYFDGVVVPVMDARRGEVYGAIYYHEECLLDAGLYQIEQLLDMAKSHNKPILLVGDGANVEGYNIASPQNLLQRASSLALLASKNGYSAVNSQDFELKYIRQSQAEREAQGK